MTAVAKSRWLVGATICAVATGLIGAVDAPGNLLWITAGVALVLACVGALETLWARLGTDSPSPARDEGLRRMTLTAVRSRADDFQRRDQAGSASIYWLAARRWRKLEREMRRRGASEIGDLPEADVRRWLRRLDLADAETRQRELASRPRRASP